MKTDDDKGDKLLRQVVCWASERQHQGPIDRRIKRAARGDYGDVKAVGDGVSELRFHFGPGYRVYFKEIGGILFLLLAGGDKSTQDRDIDRAKEIARHF